jgi:hypothetical protein
MILSCNKAESLIKFADCLGLKDEGHFVALAGKKDSRYAGAQSLQNRLFLKRLSLITEN